MAAQLATESVNEVRLVGRVSAVPEERTLPSGDLMVTFRVVTDRPSGHASEVRVDALECTAWTARVRRTTRTWRKGDVVEVTGAVRRRFFATPTGRASRVEVEVRSASMVRRATSA
ncbi:single-stranded DNA-binding protein [Nocardioides currus]|uniref:Single-stranded DNA-binding protein n=1 Tax=Nocardioides currus TaxID=2133958 RepID=A0A2R7YS20_9ACTN|nr:single-stranded DNA-binding protein [Nocardioides currus]PUA79217.1 single-stranded DNA-binding protein [Nocardioides currus]